ncbi:calcium-binding protein [Nostoc sp. 'Lobaria pulmonaria (5183) cyanobiont']|uniref:calcium-binding protein n=1 Tax=Nostoc sp. 'Lobaria pulmonaria (5183) cyanobiont' TaxID=1618022 RepID=UPI000CF336F3|nr:calcium-binding protein [Nostoc sp. 'Lobaria pulmonaria (5183) cyanobiont']
MIYKTIKEYFISIIISIPNDDLLVCTSHDYWIFAYEGNDNISASLADNLIDAGKNNDKLAGNGGNDKFQSGRRDNSSCLNSLDRNNALPHLEYLIVAF